jgi:hypothetical protein
MSDYHRFDDAEAPKKSTLIDAVETQKKGPTRRGERRGERVPIIYFTFLETRLSASMVEGRKENDSDA